MHGKIPFRAIPFTFWQNLDIFANLFKVNFSEKFRSNEAQAKLNLRFFRPKETFFEPWEKNVKNGPKLAKTANVPSRLSYRQFLNPKWKTSTPGKRAVTPTDLNPG